MIENENEIKELELEYKYNFYKQNNVDFNTLVSYEI